MKKLTLTENQLIELIERTINEQPTSEELEGDIEKKVDTIRATQKVMMKQLDEMHSYMERTSEGWRKHRSN